MLALLLPLLANCWSALLAFLARIPWHVYLVAGLFLWGLHWQHTADHAAALVAKQSTALAAAQTAAKASEQARQHEQQLTVKVREISDELQTAQAQRNAASRDAARRLRDLAAAKRTSGPGAATAAACERYEGPAAAVVRDETRNNLVDLATDAEAVRQQLIGCQTYIKNVVSPGQPAALLVR
jgi:hypothetical protein